ncbi:MAG: heme o synthase [Putridiphycobacter sp.]
MSNQEIVIEKIKSPTKMKDVAMLMKLRLSFLVVLSAVSGWFFAGGSFNLEFIFLIAGGFLITGSSNSFNQIIEKDIDVKMKRTANRPLPTGRMTVKTAYVVAAITGLLGLFFLFLLNFYSGILGLLALFMYVFIYTPLKRITPWAVFVGAFPGAIPPMLGAVAVTNNFDMLAGIMFFVQFAWQFPHFWAIAWVSDEDYNKGGFSLLPSKGRKNRTSANWILLSAIVMIPIGILPYIYERTGKISLIVGTLAGLWFAYVALKFYLKMDDKLARKLMFASFIYLPIIQFLYVFNQV